MLASCGGSQKDAKENKGTSNTEVVQENNASNNDLVKSIDYNDLVKSIDYNYFVKRIWDMEKYPDSFAYKNELPCVIDFYADWCGPCKKIAPIMEELAEEYEGKVMFFKVNVDKDLKLATVFKIRNIPTVFFLPKEGQPSSQVGGLSKEGYISIINKHLID